MGKSEYANCGQRVVAGQRLMQATTDIFLGWKHVSAGLDGQPRDFYLRQLKDWKGSFVIEAAVPAGAAAYGRACGWTLARAHARSGDRIAIASIWEARTRSTGPWRSLPRRMPIGTNSTTEHSRRPSTRVGFKHRWDSDSPRRSTSPDTAI